MHLSKTQRALSLALVIVAGGVGLAAAEATPPAPAAAEPPPLAPWKMSVFITSVAPGKGGDLGGLKGADAWCQDLARKAGAGGRTWHAYLGAAAMDGQPAVDVRDRIGRGPWFNARGVQVAANVEDLHSLDDKLARAASLSELGAPIDGRGDSSRPDLVATGGSGLFYCFAID